MQFILGFMLGLIVAAAAYVFMFCIFYFGDEDFDYEVFDD